MIRIINLPKILDARGNLTFLENNNQIPFEIKRVFWTYDVPGGEKRGAHAYLNQQEIIIALSGSFDVVTIDEQGQTQKISLNRSYFGIYLPALTWRHLENFSTNALSLHLSSSLFNEYDYVRDFGVFRQHCK
jgi:hypothetical protein